MTDQAEIFASDEAAAICRAFGAAPENVADHNERLYDLKLATAARAAEICGGAYPEEFIWRLAEVLPAYSSAGLYETRASLWGVASAVLLGWILGGFLATLLGFLGLGGEILRPAAIFALLWAGEYLGSNPSARRIILALFGLGALTRLAASLAAGAIRGFGALRMALGGISAGAGFLRLVWLWTGAILMFVFFSRRVSGLNLPVFQDELKTQIAARLKLCCFIFREAESLAPAPPEPRQDEGRRKAGRELAEAAIALLPTLAPANAAWLADALARAGYETQPDSAKYLIWDPEQHRDLYDQVGMVTKGDRCLILKRPWKAGDVTRRGLVQRVADAA